MTDHLLNGEEHPGREALSAAGSAGGEPATRHLTPEARGAWATVTQSMGVLDARLEADMHRRGGCTPFEFHLLSVLGVSEEEVPMNAAAHLVTSSLSRLSHVVRRLEQRGWVTRRTSPDDARVTLVTLTEEGRSRTLVAAEAYRQIVRELLLDHFDPEELEEFTRLHLKLLAALRPGHWLLDGSDPFRGVPGGPPAS